MTESDGKDFNDPTSRKLPPPGHTPEPPRESLRGMLPTEGVSKKLRYFVIGLTFLTIMAFGVFIAMFVKKFFAKRADPVTWGPQLVTIAEQLKDKGLKSQSIDHYQQYLNTQEVDLKTRSKVSFKIATLYVELGKCDDAVVWFLHANTAQPDAPWLQESEVQLKQCRGRSNTSQE